MKDQKTSGGFDWKEKWGKHRRDTLHLVSREFQEINEGFVELKGLNQYNE